MTIGLPGADSDVNGEVGEGMDMDMAHRVLITGGAGFIGSNLVRMWRRERPTDRVVNLDLLTYAGSLDNLEDFEGSAHYRFVRGDIRDADMLARLFAEEDFDRVVHLAAESHVDRSIAGPDVFVDTNVVGTFRLMSAARSHWGDGPLIGSSKRRFVCGSTDEVYGGLAADGVSVDEAAPFAPNSPYAASKASADHFARAFFQTYGFPVVTTHATNTYGPFQFPEKLIPVVITRALQGREVPLYGDGLQVREWLHVDDHCRALMAVAAAGVPGERYNIGADTPCTNVALVERIVSMVDALHPAGGPRGALIRHVADRRGHDRRYAVDAGKLRRELGWSPAVAFEVGLAETVAWYVRQRTWCARALGRVDTF